MDDTGSSARISSENLAPGRPVRRKSPRLGSVQQHAEEALMEAQIAAERLSDEFVDIQARVTLIYVRRLESIRTDLRDKTARLSGVDKAA